MSQPQPNTEPLTFRVGLSGTYWNRKPAYSISIDGVEQVSAIIAEDSGVVEYVEFTVAVTEDQEHLLEIKLLNKTDNDTVQSPDKAEIVKDMLLNIESISIDDIELGQIKWDHSEFVPVDPVRPVLKECVNLGWNGSYQLKFNSPFYLWLLEKM
jgi:hypothetical protein